MIHPEMKSITKGERDMFITNDIKYIGVNDHEIDLFEGQYVVPNGMSYNSYVILDEKIAVMDSVDQNFGEQWLKNLEAALEGRKPDYLVVHHMEPDHSANVANFLEHYPEAVVVSSAKAFTMIKQFFGYDYADRRIVVGEGDTLSLGKHVLNFVTAPMVHWPEVIMSYESTEKVLFSADAFGSFGALDGKLFSDEVDFDRDWLDDARRYYTNIVGKYGPHVQALLKKASAVDIQIVCPLHGPLWKAKDLGYLVDKYDKWSRYEPEENGVMIVYASMYGNMESAAQLLASKLAEKGVEKLAVYDVSNTHVSHLIAESFKYSHIVLASVTYNLGIYPLMHNYLMDMKALNMQKRTVAIMEGGSWAPKAGQLMEEFLDGMKQMTVLNEKVTVLSTLNESSEMEMDQMVEAIVESLRDA